MLELFVRFEVNEVKMISFVGLAHLEVVAIFERTLLKNFVNRVGHADLIAPVLTVFEERIVLTHHLSCVELVVGVQVFLVELYCDSGAFLKLKVNLAVLGVQADVDPGAFILLYWPSDHATFSILAKLRGS